MEANKTFWNGYASDFDAIYGVKNTGINNIINKMFRGSMKVRFQKTVESIAKERVSVLDIGCGPGHYCIALAQYDRDIIGIDFSDSMIQLATQHALELGLEKKIAFQNQNFLELDPKIKFDYSIMMGFIEYFECPEIILKKAHSITNRKILVSFPVAGGLLAFQRKLRYKRRCFLRMYSRKDIEVLMKQVDVSDYSIEKIGRDFFVTISIT